MRGTASLKVNWAGRSSGVIVGISAISDTAPSKIGYGFDPAFDGTYDDVTGDVMKASWKRGRAGDLGPMNAGETTWVLRDRNPDGSYRGRYNRQNPSSPLVELGLLRPNRPAKIEWLDDGVASSSLTASNEITDASRAAALAWGVGQQGGQTDGLQGDGSFFIGRAATNLHPHGQCDSNAGYNANGTGTVTIGAPDAAVPLGHTPQSIPVTCGGTAAKEGVDISTLAGQAAAAGVLGVGSTHFKGTAGAQYECFIFWANLDGSFSIGPTQVFTADGTDQLLGDALGGLFTLAAIAVGAGKTGNALRIRIATHTQRAETFHVASPMLEKGQQVVAPYVPTSGGVTATKPAARVQAPASLLNTTQGAVVIRLRVGWGATALSGAFPNVFRWADDANNDIALDYDTGGHAWRAIRHSAGAADYVNSPAQAFAAGALKTIIIAWSATTIKVSIDGAAFSTVVGANVPSLAATMFDIGNTGGGNQIDSDVLYAALFTGALTDTDAAWIHAQLAAGAEPWPADLNDHDPAMACTAVLPFTDTTYLIPNHVYPIAYGWLRTGSGDPSTNARTATLNFIDLFEWLDTQYPVIQPTGPITVGKAFQTLLTACGWDNPAMMQLDDGPTLATFQWNYTTSPSSNTANIYHSLLPTETVPDTDLNLQSALQAAAELVSVSIGSFFQQADGIIVFQARGSSDHLPAYATVSTVTDPVSSMAPGFDLEKVKNSYQVTLQNLDGSTLATVVYVDDASVGEFGTRAGSQISTSFVTDTNTAVSIAAAQCQETKDPDSVDLAWTATIINKTDTAHKAIIEAELRSVLAVDDGILGQTLDYVIESLSGTMTPSGENNPHGAVITLNLGMSKRPVAGLMARISNTTPSLIGSTDVIKYG